MTAWGKPSQRELQCLANALLHGRKEAADRMGIAHATLRNHLTNLNDKLDVENAREAAIMLGWLDIPEHLVTTGSFPLPRLDERHHELGEQLLTYADAILRELENRCPGARSPHLDLCLCRSQRPGPPALTQNHQPDRRGNKEVSVEDPVAE